jgi:hypothetical protein
MNIHRQPSRPFFPSRPAKTAALGSQPAATSSMRLPHIKKPEKKGPTCVNTWMIVFRRASSCGL